MTPDERAAKILKIMGYHEIDTEFSEVLPTIAAQIREAVEEDREAWMGHRTQRAIQAATYEDAAKIADMHECSDGVRYSKAIGDKIRARAKEMK